MSEVAPKPSGLSAKVDKKRKRQADESSKQNNAAAAPAKNASEGPSKKKRKDLKNKQKPEKEEKEQKSQKDPKEQQRNGGIDESIGKMDGRLLVDHFVQKAKRHNKELTAVELSDLSVPGMFALFD